MSEFEDLTPARTYASPIHVEALNEGRRVFPATSIQGQSSLDDVGRFLAETAGIIDGLLRQRGYLVPVPTTAATSALMTLQNFNAAGAAYLVERAAKKSDRLEEAKAAWRWAQKMLVDGLIDLDLPVDAEETRPRGGFGRSSAAATPFFTRNMEL